MHGPVRADRHQTIHRFRKLSRTGLAIASANIARTLRRAA